MHGKFIQYTFWVNSKTALTVFYSVLKQAKVRLLRRFTSAVRSCSLDVTGVCISEGQYVRKERCRSFAGPLQPVPV